MPGSCEAAAELSTLSLSSSVYILYGNDDKVMSYDVISDYYSAVSIHITPLLNIMIITE